MVTTEYTNWVFLCLREFQAYGRSWCLMSQMRGRLSGFKVCELCILWLSLNFEEAFPLLLNSFNKSQYAIFLCEERGHCWGSFIYVINFVFDIALSMVLDFYFKAPDNVDYLLVCRHFNGIWICWSWKCWPAALYFLYKQPELSLWREQCKCLWQQVIYCTPIVILPKVCRLNNCT